MPLSTSHIDDTFSSKEEGIKKLLAGILNINLEHEVNEKHIISVINKLLLTAKYRKEGLEYLNLVIRNCSSLVIADHGINWINHCIIKYSDDILRELKLRILGYFSSRYWHIVLSCVAHMIGEQMSTNEQVTILGEIIEIAHNESEFNKKFVSDYISKVLDNCTTTSHVNPHECRAALRTLTIAMKYYQGWFGAHRQKIEKFLVIFLDSENADLVQNAALAFHYLQQVGSAGANGMNHKLNFTQNFHKLCRTVHKLYNIFFENEKEIFLTEKYDSDDNVFEFQDDPSSNTQVLLHTNARRIRNVLKFIEIMIKTRFPVAKETKPKELLEVVTRGTLIHKCISGDGIESLETYQFSFLLSEIQCAVLKLLRLFIIWYQANCLPFSYSISKILVDSIERSHNCECFKYDSLYQESSYRALREWLSIAKSSLHPQFQSQILVCILKDVTPVKTQITLTISEAASTKKSQKAKRRAIADRIISSGNQSLSKDTTTDYEKGKEQSTCKFALTALKHLLELTKLNVKVTLLTDLYKSIFDSLRAIQSSKPLHPYTNPHCQAKLYEVLVAIYNQTTLSVLPPLQTSLDILARGTNDRHRFVSRICQRGIRNLEMLCQPICPSLYLGVEKEGLEEAQEVREMVQIEEMDVDEDVDGISSVDYDASTDEYSPNTTYGQNASSSNVYEVEQPDSDSFYSDKDTTEEFPSHKLDTRRSGSIINQNKHFDTDPPTEDELDGIGPISDNVGFGDYEMSNQKEEELELANEPVIMVLNEDDNEVLKDESQEPESVRASVEGDVIKPGCSSDFQQEISENERGIEKQFNQEVDENNTSINENPHDQEGARTASNNEEVTTSNAEENNDAEQDSATTVGSEKQKREEFMKPEDENKILPSTELTIIESDEPASKKAKLRLDDEVESLGDKFDEGTEVKGEEKKDGEEPDSNDLEDDSFVDEVKDYY